MLAAQQNQKMSAAENRGGVRLSGIRTHSNAPSKHFQRFFGPTPGLFRSRQGHFSRIRIALESVKKITKCRVAAGFLAWPRREGGGNTRSGVADALHRPAGTAFGRLSPSVGCPARATQSQANRRATLWAKAAAFTIFHRFLAVLPLFSVGLSWRETIHRPRVLYQPREASI